jgi:RNA polymerase sigma-70 factor (ECF subfamily)
MRPRTPSVEVAQVIGGGEQPASRCNAREGFSGGLEALYRSRARAFAARLTRDGAGRDDAMDFVHEAFARILGRGSSSHEQIERPEAYVARVSRNALIDHGRSSNAKARCVEQAAETAPQHHDAVVYLESRDALRRLEAAIMCLKPRTRQIFLARRVQGLSYAEICELTGLSEKAVEKQMSKAIAKLSRLMDRS